MRDLHSMETTRSGLIFTYTTYIVFGVVPSLLVSIWFLGNLQHHIAGSPVGVGWTVYFRKGGWVDLYE